MREALFIKKNRDRWLKNQHMPADDPDEMARDFTQLVDDLAYAKTFYPTSKVTHYINSQASRIYLNIYRNRKEESNRLIDFWKFDLPLTIYKHHRAVLFSFVLFLIFFSIGFFVSMQDEGVARGFFGDGYVDQTLDNIEKAGDILTSITPLMNDRKDRAEYSMFLKVRMWPCLGSREPENPY